MEWIDWDQLKGKLLEKRSAITPDGIYRAKRLVKDLSYMQVMENKAVDVDYVNDLLDTYHLTDWYESKYPYWLAEWETKKMYKDLSSN